MNHTFRIFLAYLCLLTSIPFASAQESADQTSIPPIVIGPSRLELFGYAQTRYAYRSRAGETENGFDIQRIILMVNATLSPRVSFFIMFDAASGQLHEYYGQYDFSQAFKLRVGQFKQPYTLANLMSPSALDVIDSDPSVLWMSGIATEPGIGSHTARDAGLMLTGDFFHRHGRPLFNYQIGVFNGTGRNVRENNNQKSVIGMLKFMPSQKWLLAASFAVGTCRAESDRLNWLGEPIFHAGENYERLRYAVSAEFTSRWLTARSEYMFGRDAGIPMHGCYGNFEVHVVPRLVDLVLNIDYLNKNANAGCRETQLTYIAGAQYWFYKRCRVAAQYVRTAPHSGPDTNAFVAQFQIAF